MSNVHQTVLNMWQAYMLKSNNIESIQELTESWYFCDNKNDADKLVQLVLSGEKHGTASVKRAYEIEDEPLPKIGELSIITDFDGIAKCIIKTIDVSIIPFNLVPESFAKREGEGDKSLVYWRNAHLSAFSRELSNYDEKFNENMEIVCESFEVVYP